MRTKKLYKYHLIGKIWNEWDEREIVAYDLKDLNESYYLGFDIDDDAIKELNKNKTIKINDCIITILHEIK